MFAKILNVVVVILGIVLIILLVGNSMGCQVGFSADVQAFYPDEAGKGNNVGDPRKGRYQFGSTSATERVQSVESNAKFNQLPGGK